MVECTIIVGTVYFFKMPLTSYAFEDTTNNNCNSPYKTKVATFMNGIFEDWFITECLLDGGSKYGCLKSN